MLLFAVLWQKICFSQRDRDLTSLFGNVFITLFRDEFMNEQNDETLLPWCIFPWKCCPVNYCFFNTEPSAKPFITVFLPGSRCSMQIVHVLKRFFHRFFYLLSTQQKKFSFCGVGSIVCVHSRYDFRFKQNKHVKCSKYSNCSGEILFLSAFGFVIALDMNIRFVSVYATHSIFILSSYNLFFFLLLFISLLFGKHNLDAKTGKNYGEFPLNKTYNPNNFTVKQTVLDIHHEMAHWE